MTSLLFGALHTTGVPADENVVRSTATPVDDNAPAAMAPNAPDANEVETDDNPNLGIVNRTLASTWVEGEQSRPAWIPDVDNATEHNAIINRQVSSSGTAAAREAAGEWGHGTLSFAAGLEPVADLRDGGKMGNEYFKADDVEIQEGAGNYMSVPPGTDQGTMAKVASAGKDASRKAAEASMYNAFGMFAHGGN